MNQWLDHATVQHDMDLGFTDIATFQVPRAKWSAIFGKRGASQPLPERTRTTPGPTFRPHSLDASSLSDALQNVRLQGKRHASMPDLLFPPTKQLLDASHRLNRRSSMLLLDVPNAKQMTQQLQVPHDSSSAPGELANSPRPGKFAEEPLEGSWVASSQALSQAPAAFAATTPPATYSSQGLPSFRQPSLPNHVTPLLVAHSSQAPPFADQVLPQRPAFASSRLPVKPTPHQPSPQVTNLRPLPIAAIVTASCASPPQPSASPDSTNAPPQHLRSSRSTAALTAQQTPLHQASPQPNRSTLVAHHPRPLPVTAAFDRPPLPLKATGTGQATPQRSPQPQKQGSFHYPTKASRHDAYGQLWSRSSMDNPRHAQSGNTTGLLSSSTSGSQTDWFYSSSAESQGTASFGSLNKARGRSSLDSTDSCQVSGGECSSLEEGLCNASQPLGSSKPSSSSNRPGVGARPAGPALEAQAHGRGSREAAAAQKKKISSLGAEGSSEWGLPLPFYRGRSGEGKRAAKVLLGEPGSNLSGAEGVFAKGEYLYQVDAASKVRCIAEQDLGGLARTLCLLMQHTKVETSHWVTHQARTTASAAICCKVCLFVHMMEVIPPENVAVVECSVEGNKAPFSSLYKAEVVWSGPAAKHAAPGAHAQTIAIYSNFQQCASQKTVVAAVHAIGLTCFGDCSF